MEFCEQIKISGGEGRQVWILAELILKINQSCSFFLKKWGKKKKKVRQTTDLLWTLIRKGEEMVWDFTTAQKSLDGINVLGSIMTLLKFSWK